MAQEFQRTHPDTLIIVTADHAHTSQINNAGAKPATGAAYATLQTVDGAPIRIAYGTQDTGNGPAPGGSQAHTGATVPVWASGPQAANIQGTIDQTDSFRVLNGRTPSALPTRTTTTTTPGAVVPGPAVPVPVRGPSVPEKTPRISLAVASTTLSQLRTRGVPVAVTALNVPSVKVTLNKGAKSVVSKTVKGTGSATLRSSRAKRGTYSVVASGGGKSVTKSFTVK